GETLLEEIETRAFAGVVPRDEAHDDVAAMEIRDEGLARLGAPPLRQLEIVLLERVDVVGNFDGNPRRLEGRADRRRRAPAVFRDFGLQSGGISAQVVVRALPREPLLDAFGRDPPLRREAV